VEAGAQLTVHADDLERVLDGEPFGLSGRELARRVGHRRSEVLTVLRADPRFVHAGTGRGSLWRVLDPSGTRWDPQSRGEREEFRVVVVLGRETPQSVWGAWWRP
jgi:hypothetical protein